MKQVALDEAQTHLSELVAEVEAGATIEISRDGRVVAVIVPNPALKKIDIESLRRHQASLTSPIQNTETELAEWKAESRY